jgi:hypothetical protein
MQDSYIQPPREGVQLRAQTSRTRAHTNLTHCAEAGRTWEGCCLQQLQTRLSQVPAKSMAKHTDTLIFHSASEGQRTNTSQVTLSHPHRNPLCADSITSSCATPHNMTTKQAAATRPYPPLPICAPPLPCLGEVVFPPVTRPTSPLPTKISLAMLQSLVGSMRNTTCTTRATRHPHQTEQEPQPCMTSASRTIQTKGRHVNRGKVATGGWCGGGHTHSQHEARVQREPICSSRKHQQRRRGSPHLLCPSHALTHNHRSTQQQTARGKMLVHAQAPSLNHNTTRAGCSQQHAPVKQGHPHKPLHTTYPTTSPSFPPLLAPLHDPPSQPAPVVLV